jgi:hypothetical protein
MKAGALDVEHSRGSGTVAAYWRSDLLDRRVRLMEDWGVVSPAGAGGGERGADAVQPRMMSHRASFEASGPALDIPTRLAYCRRSSSFSTWALSLAGASP